MFDEKKQEYRNETNTGGRTKVRLRKKYIKDYISLISFRLLIFTCNCVLSNYNDYKW